MSLLNQYNECFTEDGEFFDSLIPGLKEKARRVVHEKQLSTTNELLDRVRFYLSQHYNIPMYSKVFEDYSPEDMYYEYFIIQECKKTEKEANSTVEEKAKETVSTINENRDSLKSMFNDLRNPRPPAQEDDEETQPAEEDGLFSSQEQEDYLKSIGDKDGFF